MGNRPPLFMFCVCYIYESKNINLIKYMGIIMIIQKITKNTITALFTILLLAGCQNTPSASDTEEAILDNCSMPDGVEVVSISLEDSQAGDISGTNGYEVTVELNRELEDGEFATICYAVRDQDLNPNNVIASGFVGFLPGQGDTVTRDDSFLLTCNDENDVTGAQTSSLLEDMNDTSGERSTRISVQHIEGIRSIFDIPTGIRGERSQRIRVSCPR
jgi:hypothetical protein